MYSFHFYITISMLILLIIVIMIITDRYMPLSFHDRRRACVQTTPVFP